MTELPRTSATPFGVSKHFRRYVLGLLLLVMTLNYADRYVIGILLPAIKLDLDLSDTQIGFVTGAALTIFYALLGVPIASLADRYSRKKIIAWALVLWSGMTCLYGLAKSFLQLAVFRVLVGIGDAGCTPPSHSLVPITSRPPNALSPWPSWVSGPLWGSSSLSCSVVGLTTILAGG